MRRLLVSLLVLAACAGAESPNSSISSEPAPAASSRADAESPATEPTGPSPPTSPTTLDPNAVVPAGFEFVAARVTEPDGTVCELCLWLADTGEQRRRGLMFVTDLGGADGMAFLYQRPTTTRFHMTDTPLPLSISFFDPDGEFMEAFDMEPCLTDSCPRYPTPSDFLVAVETQQGELASIAMKPGSTLELLDLPCPT